MERKLSKEGIVPHGDDELREIGPWRTKKEDQRRGARERVEEEKKKKRYKTQKKRKKMLTLVRLLTTYK